MKASRRNALKTLAASMLLPLAPQASVAGARELRLTAAPGRQQIVPKEFGDTDVWAFNGSAPGPTLRFRQGERARIVVENRLPEATTVHWHGVRVPNGMDGVPHLTQAPIAPGERFVYEFDLPDSGTYWYHPHSRSYEQVARGLYGALIVEERKPIVVDRDVTWVLSDFRLNRDASQREDFENLFDLTHGGRIGNAVAINGKYTLKDGVFAVRSGERIRLRLVNAAAARIFQLNFTGHVPRIIALDGQAVTPHEPRNGTLALAPGMRADVVLDCTQQPATRHAVLDTGSSRNAVTLIEIAYEDRPLRERPPDSPIALEPNELPEPDLGSAQRHEILFEGGAMGMLREAVVAGRRVPMRELVREHHMAWTINGVAVSEHAHEPMLTLERGRSYRLAMSNQTMWPHPIHLHGHFMRIVSRSGKPTEHREWVDTVLLEPREEVEVAFVADNPGDWMFHCHVLQHQHGGMMAVFRVR